MTTSITIRRRPIHHQASLTRRYSKHNKPQAWRGGGGIIYARANQCRASSCFNARSPAGPPRPTTLSNVELHYGRMASAASETQGVLLFTSSHPSLMNLICLQSNLQEIFAGETSVFEGARRGHTCVVRGNRVIMSYFDPINIHSFPFITTCYVFV